MRGKATKKTKTFIVRITRTVTHHATVEVEAAGEESAAYAACSIVDENGGRAWVEGHIVDEKIDSVREVGP